MLDKLTAIENFVNNLLVKLFSGLLKCLGFLVPSKLKSLFVNFKLALKNKKTKIIHNIKLKYQQLKTNIMTAKMNIFMNIDKFIKYSHQKEFNKIFFEWKKKQAATPPKEYYKIFIKRVSARVRSFRTFFFSFFNSQTTIRAVSVSLILAGGFNVYLSYNEIYQTENPSRSPASVQEYDYRPDYKSFQSRTLQIMNVKVPIEVESVREISSITIDFTIRTTTRFSKLFLENYEYKLKDYFFSTVEPVVSHFPLETEGKDVLKEKITEEVNNFLRENAVEGQVEQIEIVFMVAS